MLRAASRRCGMVQLRFSRGRTARTMSLEEKTFLASIRTAVASTALSARDGRSKQHSERKFVPPTLISLSFELRVGRCDSNQVAEAVGGTNSIG